MMRYIPPKFEDYSDRQKEIHNTIANGPRGQVRGPLALWLHRPELAAKAQDLGRYCRYESSLAPLLSELAILVTARHWSAEFEWQAHKPFALQAGVSLDIIEAIQERRTPVFQDPKMAVVYDFSSELTTEKRVSDAVFQEAIERLGREGVVDLTAVLGYYSFVSMTLCVFEVPAIYPDQIEMA